MWLAAFVYVTWNLVSISCDWDRLIDPDFAGENRWFGGASYEALRVALVSNIEYVLALPQSVFRLPIVNRGWRQQADTGVTLFLIVRVKKPLTESAAVLDAAKAVRELRPIFHGAECGTFKRTT